MSGSYLVRSGHYHRRTVQKGTCSWDRTPARGLVLQCCGPFAERSRSLHSDEEKQSQLYILLFNSAADLFVTYLKFLQLVQDHVVRHVIKQPVSGGEDDVTQLHAERGAVCCVRAAGRRDLTSSGLTPQQLLYSRLSDPTTQTSNSPCCSRKTQCGNPCSDVDAKM